MISFTIRTTGIRKSNSLVRVCQNWYDFLFHVTRSVGLGAHKSIERSQLGEIFGSRGNRVAARATGPIHRVSAGAG